MHQTSVIFKLDPERAPERTVGNVDRTCLFCFRRTWCGVCCNQPSESDVVTMSCSISPLFSSTLFTSSLFLNSSQLFFNSSHHPRSTHLTSSSAHLNSSHLLNSGQIFSTLHLLSERCLHRGQALTRRSMHTASSYAQQALTHSKLLHRKACVQSKLLHQETFTHSKLLHRGAFTQSKLLHREALAQRNFCTKQALSQRDLFLALALGLAHDPWSFGLLPGQECLEGFSFKLVAITCPKGCFKALPQGLPRAFYSGSISVSFLFLGSREEGTGKASCSFLAAVAGEGWPSDKAF